MSNGLPFEFPPQANGPERDQALEDYLASLLPTPWTAVTFLNSWLNYGAPFQLAQYRKVGDQVALRGLVLKVAGGPGTVVCNLPVGFRPRADHIFTCEGYTSANGYISMRVDVNAAGNVVVGTQYEAGALGGNVGFLSLDSIRFSTTA